MRALITDHSHKLDGAVFVYGIPCSIETDNKGQHEQHLGGSDQELHIRWSRVLLQLAQRKELNDHFCTLVNREEYEIDIGTCKVGSII